MHKNSNSSTLQFLTHPLFFAHANKKIQDNNYAILKKNYDNYMQNKDYDNASLYAQKISIQYGAEGLLLYVHAQLKIIEIEKNNGEYIAQLVIKTLSFLLFAQSILHLPDIEYQKYQNDILDIYNETPKQDVLSEAHKQFEALYFANNLSSHQ